MKRRHKQVPPKVAASLDFSRHREKFALIPVIALVVVFYFWTAMSNGRYPDNPSSIYYPLLTKAFMEGQLYIDVRPAPELLALSDPYDPVLNKPYRLHDATLYHGRYYIYFGPAPVMLVFWPYLLLTGEYFPQYLAVPLFCSAGYVLGSLLFLALVRRYFPQTPLWLKIACLVSLGMADVCPFLLRRPDVYEVAIGCGYFLLQVIFYAFYRAMQSPARALPWLLLVSAAAGASVGAHYLYVMISFVFIAAILGIVWQKHAGGERFAWKPLLALVPVALIGLLLAWYNYARFDNPLEFGRDYELCGEEVAKIHFSRPENVPLNIWFYLLSPPLVTDKFPFIYAVPCIWFKMPDYFYEIERVTGLFMISPIALLTFTLPVLFRRAWKPENAPLLATLAFIAVSLAVLVLPLLCFGGVTMRYEVDFAPTFVLLGSIMLCYFHSLPRRTKIGGWALNGLFAVILLIGIWSGLCLSFTGYYDYLRFGSPETYASLQQFFRPVEIIAQAIAGMF